MSLQVSNQNPSGRRTPQVYQGFGGVVTAPNVTTTPTATNGGGPGNAPGSGSVGRPAKGNNKQSQIPVAIGSMVGTPSNIETAAPQTAVVHPGTAGTTDASPGKKQMQSDHLYGMKQQGTSMTMVPAPAPAGANRSTTNGSQPGGNEKARKSSTSGEGMGAKKVEPATTQLPVIGETGTAKGRAPTNARNQQKQSSDEGATAKGSEQQPKSEKKVTAEFENSLLAEKSLKGFGSDGEEMDSLLLEPWDLEDTQSLARSIGGKSKMQKAAPQAQARVSPFKAGGKPQTKQDTAAAAAAADKEAANSQNKNAHATESEGEKNRSPKATPKAAEADAPSTPTNVGDSDSLIGRPLRSISGRRSTRPIADIKFTHHRRSAANDSISSMNVTIGSEVGNDSLLLRTPGSASRKRKDMTPESTSDDAAVVESPKRARLDFTGLLGMVATPVTMLKNRLSRVKLHSTPRSLAVDEEDASKVVTAEATTTTTTNMSTEEKEGDVAGKAMEVDVAEKEKPDEAGQAAVSEKDAEGSSATTVVDDEVEVKIVTDQQQQKQWCSIM
ncbi:mucin-5AC-like isoform X2 [Anopheles funestus]|nr:mucin-5AC-like isoform X2 [Anopheles funestus]